MTTTLTTSVTVIVPGNPRNLTNKRVHWAVRAEETKEWRTRTALLAQSARAAAGWPLPERTKVAEIRWLEVAMFRYSKYLYDADGAWSAVKPLIDGLKGVLLVDDNKNWCRMLTAPYEIQVPLSNAQKHRQRVELKVSLVDPRDDLR